MNADVCENLGVAPATANRILTELWHYGALERIRVMEIAKLGSSMQGSS